MEKIATWIKLLFSSIDAQWKHNEYFRINYKQLKAKCETQRASLVTCKETLQLVGGSQGSTCPTQARLLLQVRDPISMAHGTKTSAWMAQRF